MVVHNSQGSSSGISHHQSRDGAVGAAISQARPYWPGLIPTKTAFLPKDLWPGALQPVPALTVPVYVLEQAGLSSVALERRLWAYADVASGFIPSTSTGANELNWDILAKNRYSAQLFTLLAQFFASSSVSGLLFASRLPTTSEQSSPGYRTERFTFTLSLQFIETLLSGAGFGFATCFVMRLANTPHTAIVALPQNYNGPESQVLPLWGGGPVSPESFLPLSKYLAFLNNVALPNTGNTHISTADSQTDLDSVIDIIIKAYAELQNSPAVASRTLRQRNANIAAAWQISCNPALGRKDDNAVVDVYAYPLPAAPFAAGWSDGLPATEKIAKDLKKRGNAVALMRKAAWLEEALSRGEEAIVEIPSKPLSVKPMLEHVFARYKGLMGKGQGLSRLNWFDCVAQKEGLKILEVEDLTVPSALVLRHGEARMEAFIAVRKGLSSFTRSFLLGHELGHWFWHAKPFVDDTRMCSPFFSERPIILYQSYQEEFGRKEQEADLLPLLWLFPNATLMLFENASSLAVEPLLQWAINSYGIRSLQLECGEDRVRETIQRRIRLYRNFRKVHMAEPAFPRVPLVERDLEALKVLWRDRQWSVVDSERRYIDASDPFCEMLEVTKERLMTMLLDDVVNELPDEGGLGTLGRQLEYQWSGRIISCACEYRGGGQSIDVLVYACPVRVSEDRLVSFALVMQNDSFMG